MGLVMDVDMGNMMEPTNFKLARTMNTGNYFYIPCQVIV
jgi:hypothetical protein